MVKDDNKIISIPQRLWLQLQDKYHMQMITQTIIFNAIMLQVSADICPLLPWPTWGLQS